VEALTACGWYVPYGCGALHSRQKKPRVVPRRRCAAPLQLPMQCWRARRAGAPDPQGPPGAEPGSWVRGSTDCVGGNACACFMDARAAAPRAAAQPGSGAGSRPATICAVTSSAHAPLGRRHPEALACEPRPHQRRHDPTTTRQPPPANHHPPTSPAPRPPAARSHWRGRAYPRGGWVVVSPGGVCVCGGVCSACRPASSQARFWGEGGKKSNLEAHPELIYEFLGGVQRLRCSRLPPRGRGRGGAVSPPPGGNGARGDVLQGRQPRGNQQLLCQLPLWFYRYIHEGKGSRVSQGDNTDTHVDPEPQITTASIVDSWQFRT
jgi:hypothetical protein